MENYRYKKLKEWSEKAIFNPNADSLFSQESYKGGYYDGAKRASEYALDLLSTFQELLKDSQKDINELKFFNNEKDKEISSLKNKIRNIDNAVGEFCKCDACAIVGQIIDDAPEPIEY